MNKKELIRDLNKANSEITRMEREIDKKKDERIELVKHLFNIFFEEVVMKDVKSGKVYFYTGEIHCRIDNIERIDGLFKLETPVASFLQYTLSGLSIKIGDKFTKYDWSKCGDYGLTKKDICGWIY